jgi:hypothetical protein
MQDKANVDFDCVINFIEKTTSQDRVNHLKLIQSNEKFK